MEQVPTCHHRAVAAPSRSATAATECATRSVPARLPNPTTPRFRAGTWWSTTPIAPWSGHVPPN